jgi:hypothetical protein
LPVRPAVYLVEEVDARVGEAGRLVLLGVRVKGRVFGVRETAEGVLKSCLRCLLSVTLSPKDPDGPRAVPQRTNVDRPVDVVGLDAGVCVAERYIRCCCRGHGIAVAAHASAMECLR